MESSRCGNARQVGAGRVLVWSGMGRHGEEYITMRLGNARYGAARRGLVGPVQARQGKTMVCPGGVWMGMARQG